MVSGRDEDGRGAGKTVQFGKSKVGDGRKKEKQKEETEG